jgi:uncharacterized membrane protein
LERSKIQLTVVLPVYRELFSSNLRLQRIKAAERGIFMAFLHALEALLRHVVDIAIVGFEFVGVFVIVLAGLRGIQDYVRKNPEIRLNLAIGMALGLEFKLGSEILRTVIVRDLTEIITVAAIIVLRAALTFLIHWEIKEEKADEEALKRLDASESKKH